jgi:hypothetical protein
MFKSAVQFRTKKKQPSLIANGKEYSVASTIDKKDITNQSKRPLDLMAQEEPKRRLKYQKQQNDE